MSLMDQLSMSESDHYPITSHPLYGSVLQLWQIRDALAVNSNPRDIQSLLEAAAQCYAQPAMMLHSPPLQDETSHSLLSLMSILGHHISDATKSMDKLHASLDAMEDEFALVLKDVMPRALASVPMQPTRRLSIKSSAPIIPPPQLQWATVSESCCSSSITASSVACSETSADDTTTEHLQMDRRQMSLSCDIEMQLLPPWPAAGSAPSPTGMAMETVSSHSYYGSEVAQNATPTPSKAKKTPKKARSTTARASSKGDDASKKRPNHSANTINTLKSWLKCHERHPYPTESEKERLCDQTGLDLLQLNNWFINARRRYISGPRPKKAT